MTPKCKCTLFNNGYTQMCPWVLASQDQSVSGSLHPKTKVSLGHCIPGPVSLGHCIPRPKCPWVIVSQTKVSLGHYVPAPKCPWVIVFNGLKCPRFGVCQDWSVPPRTDWSDLYLSNSVVMIFLSLSPGLWYCCDTDITGVVISRISGFSKAWIFLNVHTLPVVVKVAQIIFCMWFGKQSDQGRFRRKMPQYF